MSGEAPPAYQQQQQPVYMQQQQPMYQQQQQPYQQQQMYQQQQYQQQQPYGQQQQVVYVQQQQPYGQQQPVYVQQPQQQQVMVQTTTTTGGAGQEYLAFQPTTVQGEPGEFSCGTSTYGLRMDFKSRPYRDVPFLVAWIAALFLWFILLIVFGAADNNKTTTDEEASRRRLEDGSASETVGKFIGMLIILLVLGIMSGFFWLQMMFRWAKNILKFLIGLKLLVWFLLTIICFIIGLIIPPFLIFAIFFLIIFLIFALYYWCIWRRLKLAAAMIRLGTKVVQLNKATITLQFLTSIGMVVWWILWVSVVGLWSAKYDYDGLVFFLFLLMWYWTLEVLANIAHVTTCGVTAVWWFNKDKMANPTWQSYRYATSRGLGSICCGSFLVALIRTLRAMAKSGARRGGLAACCCYILLLILESLIRYFNMYAFVQVAVYGVSFWQAAKNTWQLLSSRGFDAIINDDLSNMVLAAGAFVGGCITFLVGGLIGFAMFSNYDGSAGYAVVCAVFGFYIGYYFTMHFMFAVHSAIKAIFVCWAEDPAALKETHPICYNLMANAWAKVYGGNPGNYEQLQTDMDLD